jgi:hypothetical protein
MPRRHLVATDATLTASSTPATGPSSGGNGTVLERLVVLILAGIPLGVIVGGVGSRSAPSPQRP